MVCISLEMVTVSNSPRPSNLDSSLDLDTNTEYLKMAKKGGGRKGTIRRLFFMPILYLELLISPTSQSLESTVILFTAVRP